MTLEEYLAVFEEELSVLEPEHHAEAEAAFQTKNPRQIFQFLEKMRKPGLIASKRFEEKLTEFYWRFC